MVSLLRKKIRVDRVNALAIADLYEMEQNLILNSQ
jgi:hypothetical protein